MKKAGFLFEVAALVLAAGFAACSQGEKQTLIVASETRECYGVGKQECMLVRASDEEPWTFFYGAIEGFDYEPGYEYVLRVSVEQIPDPPQDASSRGYKLAKVVSKKLRASVDLPPGIDRAVSPDELP